MDRLESVILFLIDQTSKTAKRFTQRELDKKGWDITIDQWVLLKIVEESNGLSQNELAEKSSRDGASITRSLDILEKKHYLERKATPEDRRQYKISLTPEGQAFIAKNMSLVNKHRAKSLEGFSSEEIKSLKEMLLRIQKNMS
ncbi:MarR family transcriptional regulator [Fulvivirgaceae bacterium BMA12]|uniref:MarR family transcriptional regulator n=1 Tax=Agaribacillus aureus TaxID=3051825 RepID=A0ABT8LEK9_9BACT|nr:MarR family transcriptional regulator [Fulvivirgaceae bacterium BMA12]